MREQPRPYRKVPAMIATAQYRMFLRIEEAALKFCHVCEAVVDHDGCDCGEYLPTYDTAEEQDR